MALLFRQIYMKKIIWLFIFMTSGCGLTEIDTSSLTSEDNSNGQEDLELAGIINQNSLTRLPTLASESAAIVKLGETLFSDVNLSGNRNTSCLSCHNTNEGSVDRLPLSIGAGAEGIGSTRKQINGVSTATNRNSPALFNLGLSNQLHAFFDGRVSFINGVVDSPVSQINGTSPLRSDIKAQFKNVFDVQTLFPLLSEIEMLGTNNSLSLLNDSVSIWDSILNDRLLNQNEYVQLFNNAYPNTATENLNVGHVGRALGAFIKTRFRSANAPIDRYLAGDLEALSTSQKRGMILFYTRAQCVRCHSGALFTDGQFHSSGVPQISLSPFTDDVGRSAETGNSQDIYRFKTPSLRNISLTAPYMHNGAFDSLEALVNHYSNISRSLQNYTIPASYQSHYQSILVKDSSAQRNQTRLNQVDNRALRRGLNLTAQEQQFLVDFLRVGLRDENFK